MELLNLAAKLQKKSHIHKSFDFFLAIYVIKHIPIAQKNTLFASNTCVFQKKIVPLQLERQTRLFEPNDLTV
jgi:hypothetical protein